MLGDKSRAEHHPRKARETPREIRGATWADAPQLPAPREAPQTRAGGSLGESEPPASHTVSPLPLCTP